MKAVVNRASSTRSLHGSDKPWASAFRIVVGVCVVAASLQTATSRATIIASDSAANYSGGSFITVNGGTGFQTWTSNATGGGGSYLGGTGLGNPLFGVYAGGGVGNSFTAYRQFNNALVVSSTFSVDIGTTSIQKGGSNGVPFFDNSVERGVLFFSGGSSFWSWNDGNGAISTSIPFGSVSQDLVRLSTNGYSLALAQDATTQTMTGTFRSGGSPVSSAINEVGFYSSGQGGGQNFGFNNLEIAAVPEPHAVLIVGAGACAMIPVFLRRRPNR
ncbi:MAG: hypothetical protein FJ286_06575 [Planctomycetes bacterium]|nr:hypothetical protein [Planctomycetota bacterium]